MTNYRELYNQKLVSVQEAVAKIKSGDRIVIPLGCGESPGLLEGMYERRHELKNVMIDQMLPIQKMRYMEKECEHIFRHNSWFTAGATREGVNSGWMEFTPAFFHEIPKFIDLYVDVDILFATVSPMDEKGFFSFGVSVDYTKPASKKAKKIILEVNPNMPRTLGDSFIHITEVDCLIENDVPLPEVKPQPLTDVELAIGSNIAELIEDGSTLQLGIGGIPNAVCEQLKDKKDLGVHTEMITDGMVDLVNSGVITGKQKTLHPGKIIGAFAAGSKKLYDFLHDNPMVEMHAVSYTNDPYVIGQNNKLISVNASIEIDFLGQCASETIGYKQFSATGGQADFARGAVRSEGGKGIIAIPSTAKGGTVSKIVPTLQQGAVVTTTKNDVHYVVTEYGIAMLRGKIGRQRTEALINIAHPNFREELRQQAKKMNYI